MFLKKRRKYLKPEIIVEDFLEDVTPFAESVPTVTGGGGDAGGDEETPPEAKRGFFYTPQSVSFDYDEEYDDEF